MDKKEIIARLQAEPLSLPTLEEIDFIIQDNREETLELCEKILAKADECRQAGEVHKEKAEFPAIAEKFFELERSYREGHVELWEHHNATEAEWLKVREDIIRVSDPANHDPAKFYKKLLEMYDESQMTKH